MTPLPDNRDDRVVRAFGELAEVFDRVRPDYPRAAVEWLTGPGRLTVIELGAGTGKLTRRLVEAGHDVLAVDPAPKMLAVLQEHVKDVRTAVAGAEAIPAPSRSADVVIAGHSFHWFDTAEALPEIARVLRPGGRLALSWNVRDTGIPWVKKLGRILGSERDDLVDVSALEASPLFGAVEQNQFRFWADHTKATLLDLVRSRPAVHLMDERTREDILDEVATLYDSYGRGHDGMRLPYLTECCFAVVKHENPTPGRAVGRPAMLPTDRPLPSNGPEDTGAILIDFR